MAFDSAGKIAVNVRSAAGAAYHFAACCRDGDLEGAQAFAAVAGPALPRRSVLASLRRAGALGSLALAQWLTVEYEVTRDEARLLNCYVFRHACANGHRETATWAIREFGLTPSEVSAATAWAIKKRVPGDKALLDAVLQYEEEAAENA